MRRLIPILAASALVLASVGSVAAQGAPKKANAQSLAKGQRVTVSVSRNVPQGGKAWMTVKITRCDRKQLNSYKVSATGGLGTVDLKRVGVVRNAASKAQACVWRGTVKVSASQAAGAYQMTFSITGVGGLAPLASATKTITVRAPEASGGTDHSAGSDHSAGTEHSAGS